MLDIKDAFTELQTKYPEIYSQVNSLPTAEPAAYWENLIAKKPEAKIRHYCKQTLSAYAFCIGIYLESIATPDAPSEKPDLVLFKIAAKFGNYWALKNCCFYYAGLKQLTEALQYAELMQKIYGLPGCFYLAKIYQLMEQTTKMQDCFKFLNDNHWVSENYNNFRQFDPDILKEKIPTPKDTIVANAHLSSELRNVSI